MTGEGAGERRALVIGGSMGGLLAARALSDHFGYVGIVERDAFPQIGENRRGVPQGHHTHGLLSRGAAILEQMLPGLSDEVVADGGLRGDPGLRGRWVVDGRPIRRVVTGREGLLVSRPRLEGHVRRRVLELPSVEALTGCAARGLAMSDDGRRVVGLRVQREGAVEEVVPADLVVDATGRGSQSPRWLEAVGFPPPGEERVEVDIRYMTRLYRRRPEHLVGDRFVLLAATPPSGRAGFVTAIEGMRWMVTLQTYLGERLPSDDAGFRAFAASLPAPDIAAVLDDAEPCSDAVAYHYPASQRRRYDRLRRFPEGYLVFGDAVCSFNPVYGQGMSMAAIEAAALDDCLRRGARDTLAHRFFQAIARPIESAWRASAESDLRFPAVTGRRPLRVRLANRYADRLARVAERDHAVAAAVLALINLEAGPEAVMRPTILWRALFGASRGAPAVDETREGAWMAVRDVLGDVERQSSEAEPGADTRAAAG